MQVLMPFLHMVVYWRKLILVPEEQLRMRFRQVRSLGWRRKKKQDVKNYSSPRQLNLLDRV